MKINFSYLRLYKNTIRQLHYFKRLGKVNSMDIQKISTVYRVEIINENHFADIFNLCLSNPEYYAHTKSSLSFQSIRDDLLALPPNKSTEDKYFLAFYDMDNLIAILDLIWQYPNDSTAYIGLFMTHQKIQGQGVGSFIIHELEDFLAKNGFHSLKLAIIDENRTAQSFWIKNKFEFSGGPIVQETYTVIPMQKRIG